MLPIVSPQEMAAIDAAAPVPVEVLIERAGAAVARAAIGLLGGTYGRRVVVVAGKGNNGNDGRVTARRLAARGVAVTVVSPHDPVPMRPGAADLVIDAAYGTGFVDRGTWAPPPRPAAPVLAVDIPSGVSGATGSAIEGAWRADLTVTFAATKPGLVLHPGRHLAGDVLVADIGLDTSRARAAVVDDGDVAAWLPCREVDDHKWRHAVWVIGGSETMPGAAALAARGAARAGAGYVRLSSPGVATPAGAPVEAVAMPLPAEGWAALTASSIDRFGAAVVGPGLGRGREVDADVAAFVASAPVPLVVDADALSALAAIPGGPAAVLRSRPATTVLTPHDGEFARLAGHAPGPDRFAAARGLARDLGVVVLLKGPTTVVADPDGWAWASVAGDSRLATAGSGDVLAGVVAALLAGGLDASRAAAAAAHLHGRAAEAGPAHGLVAGDLPDLLPSAWATVTHRDVRTGRTGRTAARGRA